MAHMQVLKSADYHPVSKKVIMMLNTGFQKVILMITLTKLSVASMPKALEAVMVSVL